MHRPLAFTTLALGFAACTGGGGRAVSESAADAVVATDTTHADGDARSDGADVATPDGSLPPPNDAAAPADGASPPADATALAVDLPIASGTRLRARSLVPEGAAGPPSAVGVRTAWHDQALHVDCRFVHLADDTWRCLPDGPSGLQVFADPDCSLASELMAFLDTEATDCSAGYVWNGVEGQRCDERTTGTALRILGRSNASQQTHPYVRSLFGDCNRRPDPPPPPDPGPQWIYCEAAEVAVDVFVRAEAEVRPVGDVRQLLLRAEDGAVEVHALLHPTLETQVGRDWWGGRTLQANVPEVPPPGACGGDALCEPELLPACSVAAVVRPDDCSATTFMLGDPVDPAQGCGGGCRTQGEALAEIPYAESPLGAGRLRPLWIVESGEPVQPTGFFFDEKLQVPCTPIPSPDRSIRCVPDDPSITFSGDGRTGWREVFEDEDCTNSLGYAYASRCGEAGFPYWRGPPTGSLLHLTPRGPVDAAAVFTGFRLPSGHVVNCRPTDKPELAYDAEPVEDTALATLTEVVE